MSFERNLDAEECEDCGKVPGLICEDCGCCPDCCKCKEDE